MSLNCKNKAKSKSILLALTILMLSLLSGCNSENNQTLFDDKPITITPSVTPPDNSTVDEEDTEVPHIEDFSELDKYFRDYTFQVTNDGKEENYLRTYHVSGEYDLDGDSKAEQIVAFLTPNSEEGSYIEINGIKAPLNVNSPTGEVRIIDLDSRDNLVEVGVFDDGPSADPIFLFFRYDGKELYSLGDIFRYSLLDGRGKAISWFHLTNYFKPQFFSAWSEFKDNKYVQTYNDVTQYIGKTFELNGSGFFVPLDEKKENYLEYTTWDVESMQEFKETQIKILDIQLDDKNYPLLNWFYVELPDGEKGLLYFWIGD